MENLIQIIKKSRENPSLAHIYAIEMDRKLRELDKKALTFSATGLASDSMVNARMLKLNHLFTGLGLRRGVSAIHEAEIMAKEGRRADSIAHAFNHAQGPEINSLNIFFANNTTQRQSVRLYYLNKYLSEYDLYIELKEEKPADFFYQINLLNSLDKINGPLVTVIMPAFNAENTIGIALNSLLRQSWHNLEIIVINDASTDRTLEIVKKIAISDDRIRVYSTPENIGPYACRNFGTLHAEGIWLTVHDADDIAFPDRIEQQIKTINETKVSACIGSMLRMNIEGRITRSSRLGDMTENGYQRLCFASLMIETKVFREELGAWDSVRVGGDAELIDRMRMLGIKVPHIDRPMMICLDHSASLTRCNDLGLLEDENKENILRISYKKSYKGWHQSLGSKKLSPYGGKRTFVVPHKIELNYDSFDNIFENTSRTLFHKNEIKLIAPKRSQVLVCADEYAKSGDHDQAIIFAEKYLPRDLAYTAHILRANAAITRGDEQGWQHHLNEYLKNFDIEPVMLEGNGSIFHRLSCRPLSVIVEGPLISVIMPVFNAERTVAKAVKSILNQTWRNLELLVVNDCSTDNTLSILKEIAGIDKRLKIFSNLVNVGPYVSKNIAVLQSKGQWITGQDGDDWAHPQRLENHIKIINKAKQSPALSLTYMTRFDENGIFDTISKISSFTFDGVTRISSISAMFDRNALLNKIGFWDTVRFGGDSEMISRAKRILGGDFLEIRQIGMLCGSFSDSLTNNKVHGIKANNNRLSLVRSAYKESWTKIHQSQSPEQLYLPFPQQGMRRFEAADIMSVNNEDIQTVCSN